MDDLRERFAEADRMTGRDHWSDIADRAAKPERPSHVLVWPPAPGRRAVAAVVAFGVFVAASLFAWNLSHPEVGPPSPADPPPPVDLAAELPPGWTELPPPPEVRSAAATAWTGSQLLVWGGYVFDGSGNKSPFDDGFGFDAASRTWSRMPPGPLSWRSDAAFAWTGEEFLIWGGWTGDCCDPATMFLDDGAAYDPVARRWRELPPAPIRARAPFSAWTGEELIVWGSTGRELYLRDGAAYDPSSDSWRTIAEAPLELSDATAVWTGEEMIVFGSSLDPNNRSETPTAVGAAYDPEADTWRTLPPSDLSPQAHTAGWPGGGEMIAWDYEHVTAAYDPRTDAWRRLDDVPLRFYECSPQSATVPGYIFGNSCGRLVTFSMAEDRWGEITRDDLDEWVIEPVAAGRAFLVLAHGFELSDVPGKEFDTKMLAYVPPPPSAPTAISEGHVLSEGTSNGVPWTLVTIGGEGSEGVELRWNDEQSGPMSEVVEARDGLGVAWQKFGRFDPDDAVVFGVTPPGVATVKQIPGQGLPATEVHVVDVPGEDWNAFVLTAYAAIGIVTANDEGGGRSWAVLIVPRGGERVLETVEAFLAARIGGASAETYLAPGAERDFGRMGVAPLYAGFDEGAYFRSKVLFLDTLGDGSWEVGVRLEARDGTVAEDTLFVDASGSGRPVIVGLRGGTIGP